MKFKSFLIVAASALGVAVPVASAGAATAPPNPGDFIVAMQPGGPAEGAMPDCDPELTTIGSLFMAGQTSVSVTCEMDSASTAATTVTGTVSNPTLAASTGDAGFTNGTITAQCTSKQTVDLKLTITVANSTMDSFSGTVFQACTFVMQFADASASRLLGTIELNGRLGSEDGTVVDNVVKITIDAKVFVTSGNGAFAGYSGAGTFSQNQEINVDPNNQGGRSDSTITQPQAVSDFCSAKGISPCTAQTIGNWCLANQGPAAADCTTIMSQVKTSSVRVASVRKSAASDNNKMTLTLKKSPGRARILAPAPIAGSPTAAAKVKATTRVKVTAPAGANCTVKANTGRAVGTGKTAGKYGVVSIAPRAGAYTGASTIVATCRTKAGKILTSNKVKITL